MSTPSAREMEVEAAASTSLELVATGAPPRFRIVRRGRPQAVHGELLVEMAAAEIMPHDAQVAAGLMASLGELPLVPGHAGVGRVLAGPLPVGVVVSVQGGRHGLGRTRPGTYAEHFVCPADAAVVVPDGLDPVVAAAGVSATLTARLAFVRANLDPADTVLILGAGGGVGRACMQLSQALGAAVIGIARRPGDDDDAGLVVTPEGAHDAIRSRWADAGASVVIDCVAGSLLSLGVALGGYRSRHVVLGYSAGREVSLGVPSLLQREHQLMGLNVFATNPAVFRQAHEQAMDDLLQQRVRPRIAPPFSLQDAARAYAAVGGPRVVLAGEATMQAAAHGDDRRSGVVAGTPEPDSEEGRS